MAKTLAKLTIGIAALAAATGFGSSPGRAYGDAPWCAVKSLGKGDVYWDCQYPTFAACYPNALADRGFCNVNYVFTRVMNILGIQPLMAAIKA